MSSAPVTVVVPTHEGERYIAECLASIVGQSRPPREIIVVDDGSSDRGPEIAAAFEGPVRVVRQTKAGPAAARNRGIAMATQPYLGFLDHDDLWTPSKTEVQLAALEADAGLAATFGHMVEFASPELAPEVTRHFAITDVATPSTLISCMLIRTAEFRRVGTLDEGSRADFVDWYLRAHDLGLRFATVASVVVRRRIHERNTSRDPRVKADYLRHLKASLDRRRHAVGPTGPA